jgi:hypothetical protein
LHRSSANAPNLSNPTLNPTRSSTSRAYKLLIVGVYLLLVGVLLVSLLIDRASCR